MINLYENDDYVVISEQGWGDDCEWEYYDGGYLCSGTFMYAILDKHEFINDHDSDDCSLIVEHTHESCSCICHEGLETHIGHLCEKHIHEVWHLLTNTHVRSN